jgi:hypothetical protein
MLTVLDGSCTTQINLVTKEEVVHMSADSDASNADVAMMQAAEGIINGGSIITSAQNFISKGQKFYGAHKSTIDNVLHVGKELGLKAVELLPVLLGAGMDYTQATAALEGAGFSGGGYSGGRLITDTSSLVRGRAPMTGNRRIR